MKKIKILGFIVLIMFGVFVFVYGGYDDSPGGQLLGLIAIIGGIIGLIKQRKVVRQ